MPCSVTTRIYGWKCADVPRGRLLLNNPHKRARSSTNTGPRLVYAAHLLHHFDEDPCAACHLASSRSGVPTCLVRMRLLRMLRWYNNIFTGLSLALDPVLIERLSKDCHNYTIQLPKDGFMAIISQSAIAFLLTVMSESKAQLYISRNR